MEKKPLQKRREAHQTLDLTKTEAALLSEAYQIQDPIKTEAVLLSETHQIQDPTKIEAFLLSEIIIVNLSMPDFQITRFLKLAITKMSSKII